MRGLRGEAGPFELSRRRRAASDPDGLVWLILYRGPILLVAGVHTSPKHARVYLRRQAVGFRPRFYPIRAMLRPLHLSINSNLHSSDQLPHVNLHFRLSASTVAASATPPLATMSLATASTGAALRPLRKKLAPSSSIGGLRRKRRTRRRATSVGHVAAM